MEDIPIQKNGEVQSDDDSNKEDAFAKHSPSSQVPCPYNDFVPQQMDSKEGSSVAKSEGEESRKRKGKDKHEGIAEKAGDDGCRKDEVDEKEAEQGEPEKMMSI